LDALVIGAGVSGLTTGICLAEAGLRVAMRTAEPTLQTTSTAAGALIGPSFARKGDRTRTWEEITARELIADGVRGVRITEGLLVARPPDLVPPFADEIPGFERCTPGELPDGFLTGFRVRLPLVDMPVYLGYLVERFQAAGGTIEVRPVASMAEAAAEAPLVANCAGLGARELVPDPQVVPVRGVSVVTENPGIDTFFMEAPLGPAWASWFPHGDHLVLGSIALEGDGDRSPRPDEVEEIVRRCAAIEPRLAGLRVVGQRIGLRPSRPSIRVEAERLGGARCVHNYGHGGIGVSTSWGCAREAARLLTGEHLRP
jgi:D-amino-acid oxidase